MVAIEGSFSQDKASMRLAHKLFLRQRQGHLGTIQRWLGIAAGAIVVGFSPVLYFRSPDLEFLAVATFVFGLFLLFQTQIQDWVFVRNLRRSPGITGTWKFRLDARGVKLEGPSSRGEFAWTALRSACVGRHYLLLLHGPLQFNAVPLKAMGDDRDLESAITWIRAAGFDVPRYDV